MHVLTYTAFMLLVGWKFALLNGALHFCVDFCTSRVTKRLWEAKQIHWFFTVIGFDQVLHYTCLALTYHWMFAK